MGRIPNLGHYSTTWSLDPIENIIPSGNLRFNIAQHPEGWNSFPGCGFWVDVLAVIRQFKRKHLQQVYCGLWPVDPMAMGPRTHFSGCKVHSLLTCYAMWESITDEAFCKSLNTVFCEAHWEKMKNPYLEIRISLYKDYWLVLLGKKLLKIEIQIVISLFGEEYHTGRI